MISSGRPAALILRIDRIELRLLRLPLVHFFETSFGRVTERTLVIVRLESDGVEGYGECVAGDNPYYSAETTETAWHMLDQFLIPRVLGVDIPAPASVFGMFRAVRGHAMAKAALEMAVWDVFARRDGVPIARLLGGTRARIVSGVSIGIQDTLDDLVTKVAVEVAAGYRRIKIKIKPGWDVAAVEAVRAQFGSVPLMVDANAAYRLEDAEHLRALDNFGLMMIEQPLDYDDIHDHAVLQRQLATPLCLDESIHTVRHAADAIAAGACRIVNIKPGRMGGHAESIRLHDLCAAHGVPNWHGGMLETGIGRAHNIHLASLPNFSLPGDIAASQRYFEPDLIDPPIVVAADGTLGVPDGPGLGVHVRADRIDQATIRYLDRAA